MKQADKSQDLFRNNEDAERILDTLDDCVSIIDSEYNVLYANRAMENLTGKNADCLLTMKCFQVFHGTDSPPESCLSCQCFQTCKPVTWETYEEILNKHIEIKTYPFGEKTEDKVTRLVHIVRDISEGKKTQAIMEGMNELKEKLLIAHPLEDKLKIVTDSVVELFNADFARIWITKPGDLCTSGCIHANVKTGPHVCKLREKCLHLMASSGRYTHTDGEIHRRVPFGCYKIGRVAAGSDPKFLTNDVQHDDRIHDRKWAEKLGLVSFAGYRLLSSANVPIGVLALFKKKKISPEMDVLLESIANSTAQVIQRENVECDRENLIVELRLALEEVKRLSGLIPICAECKKVRDDEGYWSDVEEYLHEHSDVRFSHGLCPECATKLYPEYRDKT